MTTTRKQLRFGIEIETVGLSRSALARAIREVVGGTLGCDEVLTDDGRRWRVVPDGSLSNYGLSGEIVSPILGYDDLPTLQEIVRAIRRAGARVDQSCGIHIHVDGAVTAQQIPTLLEFVTERWVPHAAVTQNPSTPRISKCPWNYALHYLGDKPLTELLRPSVINAFVEAMKTKGPIAFKMRSDGKPPHRKPGELTNATINQSLKLTRALLFLAHAEGVIPTPPKIDLLP